MPSKVTQHEIAERAQVDTSSVSLALRGSPRISPETHRHIWDMAKKMGYRPNPLVTALMQSRRKPSAQQSPVIAYVTNLSTANGSGPPNHDLSDHFLGAAKRASELGYKLEHFRLHEPNQTTEQLCRILTSRGIRGLLIGKLLPGEQSLDLQWQKFTCVAVGMTLHTPSLHRVTEDYYTGAAEAMEQIYQRGYKRVGFVSAGINDAPRIGERWLAAFLVKQLCMQEKDRLPPFDAAAAENPVERFHTWFASHKPDALLTTHAKPVLEWLQQIGKLAVTHVGLATLVNDHPALKISGIHCNAEKLGSLAVEMLVDSMYRNEFGIPIDPHEVLINGVWHDGQTCTARTGRNSLTTKCSLTEYRGDPMTGVG
jgi:DNA-binding LacI/PurR family transcriptional regulator